MSTDDGLRSAPLRQRVPKAVEEARASVPLAAAGARAPLPIKNPPTLAPWPGTLDEIPERAPPGLMPGRRRLGACRGVWDPGLPQRGRRGLRGAGPQRPDSGMAIAIAQRIQGHGDAIVPHQRMGVQQLEDGQPRLDRDPQGERRVRPGLPRQAHQAPSGAAALPIIDHGGWAAEEGRHTAWTEAHLAAFDHAPAGLRCRGLCAVRPAPEEELVGLQGLQQAWGVGSNPRARCCLAGTGGREAGCVRWACRGTTAGDSGCSASPRRLPRGSRASASQVWSIRARARAVQGGASVSRTSCGCPGSGRRTSSEDVLRVWGSVRGASRSTRPARGKRCRSRPNGSEGMPVTWLCGGSGAWPGSMGRSRSSRAHAVWDARVARSKRAR
jgi:hypothetical protein